MARQKISIGMLIGIAVIEAVLISAALVALHRPEWIRVAVPLATFITLLFTLSCPRVAKRRGRQGPINSRREGWEHEAIKREDGVERYRKELC